jgi:hypothetical protein
MDEHIRGCNNEECMMYCESQKGDHCFFCGEEIGQIHCTSRTISGLPLFLKNMCKKAVMGVDFDLIDKIICVKGYYNSSRYLFDVVDCDYPAPSPREKETYHNILNLLDKYDIEYKIISGGILYAS